MYGPALELGAHAIFALRCRSDAFQSILASARSALLARVDTLSPAQLLELLEASFPFISIPELQVRPVAIRCALRCPDDALQPKALAAWSTYMLQTAETSVVTRPAAGGGLRPLIQRCASPFRRWR